VSDFEYIPEGKDYVNANGWPATVFFLLSSQDVATLGATPTLAGGVGEITGTGYARKSQARPTSSAGKLQFTQMSWATGAAADWPASVKSCIAVTSSDNTGKALAAWNLQTGGAARAMNAANTTENFTPDFTA
jgi:hypothetical protein